jgi:hypothetical protein
VPFEDGPALGQAGRRVVLDEGPGVIEVVAGGEMGAEDRVGDADPVRGAGEGQDVEVEAAALGPTSVCDQGT